jgi:hypothetical protein
VAGGVVGGVADGKLLSHLNVAFTNGVTWEFDVPKANKKTAQNLVRALG